MTIQKALYILALGIVVGVLISIGGFGKSWEEETGSFTLPPELSEECRRDGLSIFRDEGFSLFQPGRYPLQEQPGRRGAGAGSPGLPLFSSASQPR